MTFDELCALEPGLRLLYEEARAQRRKRRGPHYCANATWYVLFKPRLSRLVGWERPDRDPVLGSSEAYDLAYHTVYEALPDCKDCNCLRVGEFL
jgi:hypothetical protein